MSLRIEPLAGAELEATLEHVARLRIAVFSEWPYLYDGNLEYERRYLEPYRSSRDAIVVGAWSGDRLVGAATGTPMEDHAEDLAAPLRDTGLELRDIYYCAESVLLPEFRGKGAGHAFFDLREAHARALGRRFAAFCAVVRPEGHPLWPAGYTPLDPFWRKRGYRPLEGAVAEFRWKDIDESRETAKPLQFWIKSL